MSNGSHPIITICLEFIQPFEEVECDLPTSLRIITIALSEKFNQPQGFFNFQFHIDFQKFPLTLKSLTLSLSFDLGNWYNLTIEEFIITNTFTTISFVSRFNQIIKKKEKFLPNSLSNRIAFLSLVVLSQLGYYHSL
ncbi:hypothetical protein ACTFIV_004516 [Dictyostelium citrinum]